MLLLVRAGSYRAPILCWPPAFLWGFASEGSSISVTIILIKLQPRKGGSQRLITHPGTQLVALKSKFEPRQSYIVVHILTHLLSFPLGSECLCRVQFGSSTLQFWMDTVQNQYLEKREGTHQEYFCQGNMICGQGSPLSACLQSDTSISKGTGHPTSCSGFWRLPPDVVVSS